ncbi:MAG TPA: M15 family metallopeptidase [Thermoanaerobaculia bacterium]|nr:M15 family metallopeptidase [Thermoanaerobaculia bacterium]
MATTQSTTSSKKKKPAAKQAGAKKPAALPAAAAAKAMLSAKTAAAAEPPKDRDYAHLSGEFRAKLQAVLAQLEKEGTPFKFDEGFRPVERQQWLYGSGRPNAKPFGRPGPVVTQKDGVKNLSNHQGDGTTGSGNAADCYPMAGGKIIWPPPKDSDPRWKRYAELAEAQGLQAGMNWPTLRDTPHVELKKK